MKKTLFASLVFLFTLFMLTSCSHIYAVNKKTKKETKEDLRQKEKFEAVKAELAKGADPNRKNGKMTWLGSALSDYNLNGKYPEITNLLINTKGIKLNEWIILVQPELSWKYTAIMDAVAHPEMVTLMLDKGALINLQDEMIEYDGKLHESGGNTPLIHAIGSDGHTYTESAKIMIARGANIELLNRMNQTALIRSVHNTEIAKILIDKGAKLDIQDLNGQTALMYAAEKYSEVVKLLLDKGADILIRQQAKFKSSLNALGFAARAGNLSAAKLIIERATKLNVKSEVLRASFHWAVIFNHIDVANYLLDEGGNIEGDDDLGAFTPLMETSDVDMVQLLLKRGANVNAKNNLNYTPLHKAVFNFIDPKNKDKDNEKILNLLLEKGANVDAQDKNGITPLMGAVAKSSPTKILLEKNVNVNLQNNNGETALMYAVKGGLLKVSFGMPVIGSFDDAVKLLLAKGADINAQDKWGKTALMHAAGAVSAQGDKYSSFTDMLNLLLESGAKLELKDKEGHTALYWAQRFGRTKSAEALIAKGADATQKYDKKTDKSNVKAGIVGTWTNTTKIDIAIQKTTYTMVNKVVFNADWTYSRSMTSSGKVIPDGGGYNSYDLRDGKIWLFNAMGTNMVYEFSVVGNTLTLNGEKFTKTQSKK